MFGKKKTDRVYLDWAAATPLLPEAKVAMEPFLDTEFGNPSAVHAEGVKARQAVEAARDTIARSLEVRSEFITFTSGGTEANNLVIFGLVKYLKETGRDYSAMEVVTTCIEHPSVIKAIDYLAQLGVVVKYVGVDETGKILLEDLRGVISDKTVLVSCAYANSEIGVVQPLHSIKKVMKEAETKYSTSIYFHVDAAQAPLWLSCHFDSTGADFLTLDAAKCCGPKGVGVLVRSRRAQLRSVVFGGDQEGGLRSGTENVAGIVGASIALKWAQDKWKERAEKTLKIRDQAFTYISEQLPSAVINGPVSQDRLANNINISIPSLDTEFATIVLDKYGFAVSTKSACSGASGRESLVVKEISGDSKRAGSTLRISIGPNTEMSQLNNLVYILKEHVEKMSRLT